MSESIDFQPPLLNYQVLPKKARESETPFFFRLDNLYESRQVWRFLGRVEV